MNDPDSTISPPPPAPPRPISEILIALKDEVPRERVSMFDLLEALHNRGFGFLLFLFALPAALPLPGLGVNVIIALPLLFLTAQQAMGRHSIWIPKKIKHKSIERKTFDGMIDKAIPFVKKIEFFVRPRFGLITHGLLSNLIGILGLVMALSICVPLPLTNTVPAFGIALMAVGVIMRDGLAVIAGALIGTAWVFMIFFVILFFGMEGVELVKETIKGWL